MYGRIDAHIPSSRLPVSSASHMVKCMPDDMFPAVVNRVFTWVLPPRILLVAYIHLVILGGSTPRMHRMDVTNIYKYPQGEVLLGLDGSLSEV